MLRLMKWLLAPAVLTMVSCGGGPGNTSQAVVLIVIDTLRADHLGSYGYEPASTPNLDALAARGVRFANAVTPVPVTLPAMASLLTGRYPYHHGVRDNERYVMPQEEHTLAERFKEEGWRTGAVVASAIIASDRGLDQGFDTYDDAFTGPYAVYQRTLKIFAEDFATNRRRADTVTDLAVAMIDEFGKDPFFLLVHYFDVHGYYDPPPEYRKLHPRRPYDGEISFTDAQIGRLLDHLQKRSDATVLVVSDHGEGLGDHDETEHGFLLYQSTLAVPVIAAGPGIPEGLVRNDPVSLVDLEPTLGEWLHLPAAGSPRDGRTLSWDTPETELAPLYAETCRSLVSYSWSELRSVREGDLKVIVGGPVTELYDLGVDPEETHDLGNVDPAPRLRDVIDEMTGGESRDDVLAALREDPDPDRKELLESLGYVSGTDSGEGEEGRFPHPRTALPEWRDLQVTKATYRKAVTLAVAGDYDAAIVLFDSVLVTNPRADVYFNRGMAKRKNGDEAGFREDLQKSLAMDGNYISALSMQATLDYQAGMTDRALAGWEKIHRLDSRHVPTLKALAQWYADRGDWERALPLLRSLVNELPQDPTQRYNLGIAATEAGFPAEARIAFETFLRVAPGDPRVEDVRRFLAELDG